MQEVEINISKKMFLPCYWHLINNKTDIDFLYGGRDSGKSQFIAQILIYACLSLPYFRCMLIKKTFNSIKDSQWQTLKDVVDLWGLSDLFVFKSAPLSIECINGNKFIARGCDEPQSIKSTKDPSHTWIEEGNQLTLDDFITVTTSLRAPEGAVIKQYISFNPECDGDYKDFWLYKTFFNEKPIQGNFDWTVDLTEVVNNELVTTTHTYTYSTTHTTYKDNKYCKPSRIIFLEKLKEIDPYYYKVYTLGLWGNRKVGDAFCFSFNPETHIKEVYPTKSETLYLSFDFNVNPITCGVYQHKGKTIHGLESIKLENSDIYKLCDHIRDTYPGYVYIITGDATGKNTSAMVQDGINYYTIIKKKLRLGIGQIKVPSVNPKIEDNRVLVNAIFTNYKVKFHPSKCKGLIFDCGNVEVDDVGKIDKGDRNNPKKRADHLDNWRYYLNTFHKNALKE